MPLKKGHSREVVSSNIKEMVAAGHPIKQAIAASLSNARKYKKMAMGGDVHAYAEGGFIDDDDDVSSDFDEGANRSIQELKDQTAMNPDAVYNPYEEEREQRLAKALYDQSEHNEIASFAVGGLVDANDDDHAEDGAMPESENGEAGPEASPLEETEMAAMGHGLSDEAKLAIMAKRKARRISFR